MYIQGTKDFGLRRKNNKFTLIAYSKVDFEGDIDDETSTSGYLINIGLIMVSWSCEKQVTMANSSTKAKYISAWEADKIHFSLGTNT